jgi:nitric oxide reductase NorE protein
MTAQQAAERDVVTVDVASGTDRLLGNGAMWLFVLGDLFIFLAYFVIFMVYRHGHPTQFLDSQRHLDLVSGVSNTLVLLASSYLVARAVEAARQGLARRASTLVVAGGACGLLFMAIKADEWVRLSDHGFTFTHDDFFMFYFALTGVHLFHVLMGLVVLAVVRRELRSPRLRVQVIEAGAVYWHMVDLLWVALFALLYVMR